MTAVQLKLRLVLKPPFGQIMSIYGVRERNKGPMSGSHTQWTALPIGDLRHTLHWVKHTFVLFKAFKSLNLQHVGPQGYATRTSPLLSHHCYSALIWRHFNMYHVSFHLTSHTFKCCTCWTIGLCSVSVFLQLSWKISAHHSWWSALTTKA